MRNGSRVAGRGSRVAGRRLWVAGRRSRVAGRGLRVAGRGRRVAGRGLRVIIIAILLLVAIPAVTMACPACYGAPGSPMTKGATHGVWFMLGIVGFVQIGFAAMFIGFWRRARALQRVREQLHVIEGGRR
jgi:hypothetical protein